MTILVVDDETFIRDMIIAYLADDGYPAEGAANGREALECLRARSFHLVLLDVMMPIMDGWQLLQAMCADPTLATIPVVMMTASANVHEIALELGATAYLPKPLDFDEVMEIVRSYMGHQ